MTLSIFRLYEYVTKSARVAGIAVLFYMANPHFLLFDVQFSYESLALPLATFMLFILTRYETLKRSKHWIMVCVGITLSVVVVTHHMTSYIFDGLLILWAIVYKFNGAARFSQVNPGRIALFGVIITLIWTDLNGNPVIGYLSSYFGGALDELQHVLTGTSQGRHLFAVYYGQPTPLWERMISISSLALILLCLPFGLLCLWQRYRTNTFARMLALASLLFPISQVFRFTNFGSEITDRGASFLFIPISCILAVFISQFWPARQLKLVQRSLITGMMSVLFLGGAILGAGPPWELLPGPYLVAADQRSIEPEGIETAQWAYVYLGPDNRMAADRINKLLMDTYGDQDAILGLEDNVNLSPIFFSSGIGTDAVAILRRANVRYIVVDLRLGKALPALGFYVDSSEPDAFQHTTPINSNALTKFDASPEIGRVFDCGDILIYDIGGLTNASKKT
jgi:hypothetical protein